MSELSDADASELARTWHTPSDCVSWTDLIAGIGRHNALLFGDIDDLVQSYIELRGGPATESDRYREELEREFPIPD